MRVVLLGPSTSPAINALRSHGDTVAPTADPIDLGSVSNNDVDFLVSHGYRHIVSEAVLAQFSNRAINLHISLLPWNRGAHPNLWSVLEDTPSGVTIHHMDPGIDTGDIIAQRSIDLHHDDTLRTSYDRLQRAVIDLLEVTWPAIRAGRAPRHPQHGNATVHRVRDIADVEHLLTQGWDTPVAELKGRVKPSPM